MGNFDGVHRGHQAVIGEAGDLASRLDAPLAVLTTEPHPRNFFQANVEPFRLTPFRAKAHHLEAFGVDVMVVLHFDKTLAGMTAQDFVLDVLLGGLGAHHVVVGYDYRFGKGRGGGVDVLRWMGLMEDFGVTVMAPIGREAKGCNSMAYSSSSIREALKNGRPRAAAAALGHWWTIDGQIVQGDRRGRTIGFPTINIAMTEYIKPLLGVYAVRVMIADGPHAGLYNAVANIGRRPTFGRKDVILEAHLLDFTGDLYGRHAHVEVVDFIRPEMKFAGLDALKPQIARDCEAARELLARTPNARDALSPPQRGR